MFLGVIEILKEFKDWTPKGRTLFVASLLIAGVGGIYYWNYVALKEENLSLKEQHNTEVAKIHSDYNDLLVEQRKKYQTEVDSYVLETTKDYNQKLRNMYEDIENYKTEINMLRREIKNIKNEVTR